MFDAITPIVSPTLVSYSSLTTEIPSSILWTSSLPFAANPSIVAFLQPSMVARLLLYRSTKVGHNTYTTPTWSVAASSPYPTLPKDAPKPSRIRIGLIDKVTPPWPYTLYAVVATASVHKEAIQDTPQTVIVGHAGTHKESPSSPILDTPSWLPVPCAVVSPVAVHLTSCPSDATNVDAGAHIPSTYCFHYLPRLVGEVLSI